MAESELVQVPLGEGVLPSRERGLWTDAFHRLRQNRLAMAALIFILMLVVLAIAADRFGFVRRYDPLYFQDHSRLQEGPSRTHLFGTDNLGRDNWSRVVKGISISLQIGIGTQVVVLLIGLLIGGGAALGGRFLDNLLMRFTDMAYAFPDLLFIILLRSVLQDRNWPVIGNPKILMILAIALVNWTIIARLVRGQMLSLSQRDYVLAAKAMGAKQSRIVVRHMLPNALGPVIVAVTFGIPIAIFAEAALGFIGLGLPPPTPSLGRLVADGRIYIQTNYWVVVFPAAAVAFLMLCFTFLGDGLRDALDPRMR